MSKRNHFHVLYFGSSRCVLTWHFSTSSCTLPRCDNSSMTCDKCPHSFPYVFFND